MVLRSVAISRRPNTTAGNRKASSFRLFDFSKPQDPRSQQQRKVKAIYLGMYRRRYRWYLFWGVIVAIVGVFVTVISVLCIMILTDKWLVALTFHTIAEFRADLTTVEWKICLFLYYLRYPGPVLAGVGIFILIMTCLFIDWLADQEVAKMRRRPGGKPNIYDKLAASWQRQQSRYRRSEALARMDLLLLNYKPPRDSLSSDNRSLTPKIATSHSTPTKNHQTSNGFLSHPPAKRSSSARSRILNPSYSSKYSPLPSNRQSKCLVFATCQNTPNLDSRRVSDSSPYHKGSSNFTSCRGSLVSSELLYETPRNGSFTSSSCSYQTADDESYS